MDSLWPLGLHSSSLPPQERYTELFCLFALCEELRRQSLCISFLLRGAQGKSVWCVSQSREGLRSSSWLLGAPRDHPLSRTLQSVPTARSTLRTKHGRRKLICIHGCHRPTCPWSTELFPGQLCWKQKAAERTLPGAPIHPWGPTSMGAGEAGASRYPVITIKIKSNVFLLCSLLSETI